ncbi:unnamed protein product [Calypogeia fissa]
MQGYSTPSLLYDEGFFGRSELNFNDNGPGGEPTISSGLLGLSDSLDRLDTASSFGSGSLQQAMGDASLGSTPPPPDSMNAPPVSSHQNPNVSGDNHSHHQHGEHGNSFGVDENGNLVMQDVLHHNQIMNANSIGNNNNSHGHGSNIVDRITTGVSGERSSQVSNPSNGVTSQWEESLQDLQSLLALHGQQHSQIVNMGLPMTADQGPSFMTSSPTIRASGGYGFEKGQAGSTAGGFHNSKFPVGAPASESELLSLLHFPRPNSSSLQQQQQIVQAPAGPVSAFPSNPGFRKGSGGSVNSSSNTQIPTVTGLYSSSRIGQNLSSFPYTASSLVGSNYFSMNSGHSIGNLNSFLNHGHTPGLQKQLMRAPSIIDLDQARDNCNEDNISGHGAANSSAAAAKFSSSLFESAKRSGSEGNLLLSGKGGSEPRGINHFATERQRREYLNEKYQTLRSLVPNPSKADRASIVADAIEYVKELKRTVQELQLLVQEKRKETSLKEAAGHYCSGSKRRRDTDDSNAESSAGGPVAEISSTLSRSFSLNLGKGGTVDPLADICHLRNSWLQRTSQSTGTHVDVRIVHDEVTIKVTQRRRKQGRQLLLHAMITLSDLHLDLQHANGANIGEHDVYVFNTKILQGSSTFAGYVVTKFLEAVDRENPPP